MSGATGPSSRRSRTGADRAGALRRQVRPVAGAGDGTSRASVSGAIGSSVRRSRGACGTCGSPPGRCEPGRMSAIVVEAEDGVGLGQCRGQAPRRTARPGSRPRRPTGCGPVLRSAAASSVSIESFFACLDEAAGVDQNRRRRRLAPRPARQPSAASRPASSSESTSLRAQPRVTSATERRPVGGAAWRGRCASRNGGRPASPPPQPAAGSSASNGARATSPLSPGAPMSRAVDVEVDAAGVADHQLQAGLVGEGRFCRRTRSTLEELTGRSLVVDLLTPAAVRAPQHDGDLDVAAPRATAACQPRPRRRGRRRAP